MNILTNGAGRVVTIVVPDVVPEKDPGARAQTAMDHYEEVLKLLDSGAISKGSAVVLSNDLPCLSKIIVTLKKRGLRKLYMIDQCALRTELATSLRLAVREKLPKEIVVMTDVAHVVEAQTELYRITNRKLKFREGGLAGEFGGHAWGFFVFGYPGAWLSWLQAQWRLFHGASDGLTFRMCAKCQEKTFLPYAQEVRARRVHAMGDYSEGACWFCQGQDYKRV